MGDRTLRWNCRLSSKLSIQILDSLVGLLDSMQLDRVTNFQKMQNPSRHFMRDQDEDVTHDEVRHFDDRSITMTYRSESMGIAMA